MAVAEITRRHATELALTWWRRETSPVLLHHGTPLAFDDLDARLATFIDGASLDPTEVFQHLASRMDPSADDFVADVVSGLFVLQEQREMPPACQAWLAAIPDHRAVATACGALMRWMGHRQPALGDDWLASLRQSGDDARPAPGNLERISAALHSHKPGELRFIDAWGQVQGHYAKDVADIAELPPTATPSQLCTHLLLKPQHTATALQKAVARGEDPATVFLAAGISGDTSLLPNLLQSASQPEVAFLALDAFRRITGFDALAGQGLAWTHQQHTIKKPLLKAAYQSAQDWFDAHAKSLPEKNCFLGKAGDDIQNLVPVLRHGRQADREIAAMRTAANTIFPVRSKVSVQRMVLDHFYPEFSEAP